MPSSLTIRAALPDDIAEISELHARVFGPGRFARSAYRVREGKGHLSRFCLVACLGKTIVASIRTTEITVGGKSGAVLLGPVAVDSEHRSLGLGSKLIAAAFDAARTGGAKLIVLVGDDPYYGRFGFKRVPMDQIVFPGPVDPQRILACELEPNSLAAYQGLVVAEPPAKNPG
ncbi:GNAT family N-acetyltransferase [Hyphomicrobium sp.]|jgi:predicted N-acetyltransferase YhbS|uniref:GNAT family N-acetyltransferase n=1 Tax=Hyphomicrobium sp. TaxID=82 RepID=UPI003569CED3